MTVQEAIKWLKAISVTLEMNDFHKSSVLERKEALHMGIQSMREVEQYRSLGTVEELKEAREKQVAKKPIYQPHRNGIMVTNYKCPVCECRRLGHGIDLNRCYCPECGQKLDWSEEDD